METHAHIVFNKIITHLSSPGEVDDIKSHLTELVRALFKANRKHILEWFTTPSKMRVGSPAGIYELVFDWYRIRVTYHYMYEMASYASIFVVLLKDYPKADLSIKKVAFLYDSHTLMITQLENEIPRP